MLKLAIEVGTFEELFARVLKGKWTVTLMTMKGLLKELAAFTNFTSVAFLNIVPSL